MVPVALEAQHGVDQVLEGPGTGQRAVLGHVADQDDRPPLWTWPVPTSWSAHSRTWVTLPGTPVVRRSPGGDGPIDTAWMESTTTRAGSASATAATTAPISVTGRMSSPGGTGTQALGPQAHLVGRLLGRDEQDPVAGRGPGGQYLEEERRLADARLATEQGDRAGHQSTRRAPGRTPPDPVGTAAASDTSTEDSWTGMVESPRASTAWTREPSWASSTRVFHSPQVGQRPAQRAVVDPQSMQRWRFAVLAMPPIVGTGCDIRGDRWRRRPRRPPARRRPVGDDGAVAVRLVGLRSVGGGVGQLHRRRGLDALDGGEGELLLTGDQRRGALHVVGLGGLGRDGLHVDDDGLAGPGTPSTGSSPTAGPRPAAGWPGAAAGRPAVGS